MTMFHENNYWDDSGIVFIVLASIITPNTQSGKYEYVGILL